MPKWKLAMNDVLSSSAAAARAASLADYAGSLIRKGKKHHVGEILRQFVPKEKQSDKAYLGKVARDMMYSRRRYLVSYPQYFLFRFEEKTDAERRTFVGEFEKKKLTYALHSDLEVRRKFFDKYLAYETFKPYYHREMLLLASEEDLPKLEDFAKRHPLFLLKALDKAEGKDIFRFDLREAPETAGNKSICHSERGEESQKAAQAAGASSADSLERARTAARAIFPCVAEEYLAQAPAMAAFHPASVNTIRYVTFLRPDKLVHMYAILRTGSGDSIVDNAGSGGICASVDPETGVILTDGFREDGTSYTAHPDSGVVFKGTRLPRWDELIALVEELARVVPEQKYVGWYLALTPDGWCMIEGNDRAMFTAVQMCEQKGLRPVIEETFLCKK